MRYMLLEPLRGVAALWVFCFHYHFSEEFQQACPSLHAVFKVGHLGVPMFFVLSGYCITASARSAIKNDESWTTFLWRRVRRIYPPYWFSIAVVALIPFLIELVSSFKTGHYEAPSPDNPQYGFLNYRLVDWLSVGTLTEVFVPVPGAHSLQAKFTTINAVYWTLAIEVQFYLVIVLALVLRKHFYRFLLAVTLLSVPFLAFSLYPLSGLFFPYWPMFAFGVCLCWLVEHGFSASRLLRSRRAAVTGVVTTALAIAFVVYVVAGLPVSHVGFAAAFGVFLFALEGLDHSFTSRALGSKRRWVRLPAKLAVALGAMSYSLYLLHGRLQFLVMQPLRQLLPPNRAVFDAAVIAVTCALCYVFYFLLERPFIGSRGRRPQRSESGRAPERRTEQVPVPA